MRKWSITLLAAAAAVLPALPAQAAPTVAGDPVLYWNQLLIQSLPASPILASRHAAIFNTAIHDAVNAAQGARNHGYLGAANPNGGDARAATAAAAYTVLKSLYGDKPAYQAAYDQSLALVTDSAARDAGVASGQGYAAQLLTQRAADGWNAVVPYTPSGLPGRYAYTPGSPQSAAGTQWGAVTPFLLSSGSQFRPGPPPAIDSVQYAAAYNEVKLLGDKNGVRDADHDAAASYWVTASGPAPWLQVAINSAEANGSSVMANATLFARLSDAIMDSSIALFEAKYHYDFWRPVTAIRNGDADGNAGTVGDAAWLPYIAVTPNHPSYISGHSAIAGTSAALLANAFGDTQSFCLTWASQNRCWANFTASAEDAAMSRLWGGIHYRFDNDAGLALGRSVAAFTLDARAFGAAPEPGVWAMLVLGFGAIGSGLRRRRPVRAAELRYVAA